MNFSLLFIANCLVIYFTIFLMLFEMSWKSFIILGPPDAPRNCTLSNQTQESLQVDCVEGYSSGLTQEFHMEVFSGQNHQLIVNITARSPKLLARGLPPGRSLFLRVYASNSKGRSRSVTFDAYTLQMADKHPGKIKYDY